MYTSVLNFEHFLNTFVNNNNNTYNVTTLLFWTWTKAQLFPTLLRFSTLTIPKSSPKEWFLKWHMTGVTAADNAALHIRNKLNVKIYSKQNQLF